MLRDLRDPAQLALMIVMTVVVAPVTEEMIFRARVFRFLDMYLPTPWAALITSVPFALLHGKLLAAIPLIVLSMALCFAYRRTGRIITPIVLHAVFNLNSLVVTVVTGSG